MLLIYLFVPFHRLCLSAAGCCCCGKTRSGGWEQESRNDVDTCWLHSDFRYMLESFLWKGGVKKADLSAQYRDSLTLRSRSERSPTSRHFSRLRPFQAAGPPFVTFSTFLAPKQCHCSVISGFCQPKNLNLAPKKLFNFHWTSECRSIAGVHSVIADIAYLQVKH